MKLSDIGEFGLIERIATAIGAESSDVVVGPGDDAAVWRVGGRLIIATTDSMVDGVHFQSEGTRWRDLGWKALAVNLSDIAAMGGSPAQALVTLCLPPELEVGAVDDLYAGMLECAHEYGVSIAGGDVVRSPVIVMTVALLGTGEERDGEAALLLRSRARVGDMVAVTGTPGDSAGGLRRMAETAATKDQLVLRHLRPEPRVKAGQAAVEAGVRCGIDISDGLLQDLGHICEMSGVGAVVRAGDVPLSEDLRAAYPDDALEMACTGGEDYELILVGRREGIEALPATVIGEITEGSGVQLVDAGGGQIEYERTGWDAFRP
jgi:thiamine-monophosphate kinase